MLQALRLFPAVVIVPTMQISWTLFSVVSGGIYYQEYHAFTPFTASMFGLGVLVSHNHCMTNMHPDLAHFSRGSVNLLLPYSCSGRGNIPLGNNCCALHNHD